MEAKDAIRVAKRGNIGLPYEPSEQLEHGGMDFTGRTFIPFYNPDHGPTSSDPAPPIPAELRPITERWYNPDDEEDPAAIAFEAAAASGHVLTAEDLQDIEDEEVMRREAAERVLGLMPTPEWKLAEEREVGILLVSTGMSEIRP